MDDKKRFEKLDPTPVSIPIGFEKPPSIAEEIRRFIRSYEFEKEMKSQGYETFDEADDFEVGDDYDPHSPYELEFDPDLGKEITREERARLDVERARFDSEILPKIKKKAAIAAKNKKNKKVVPPDTEDSEGDENP